MITYSQLRINSKNIHTGTCLIDFITGVCAVKSKSTINCRSDFISPRTIWNGIPLDQKIRVSRRHWMDPSLILWCPVRGQSLRKEGTVYLVSPSGWRRLTNESGISDDVLTTNTAKVAASWPLFARLSAQCRWTNTGCPRGMTPRSVFESGWFGPFSPNGNEADCYLNDLTIKRRFRIRHVDRRKQRPSGISLPRVVDLVWGTNREATNCVVARSRLWEIGGGQRTCYVSALATKWTFVWSGRQRIRMSSRPVNQTWLEIPVSREVA